MCVAAPCRIIEVKEKDRAMIDNYGVEQEISTIMIPEVKVGDYVMVYLGSALAIVDEKEAEEVIHLFQEMEMSQYDPSMLGRT